jgi:hypothetical protein
MSNFEDRLRALEAKRAGDGAPAVVLIVRLTGMTDDQIAAAADAKARAVPLVIVQERDGRRHAPPTT